MALVSESKTTRIRHLLARLLGLSRFLLTRRYRFGWCPIRYKARTTTCPNIEELTLTGQCIVNRRKERAIFFTYLEHVRVLELYPTVFVFIFYIYSSPHWRGGGTSLSRIFTSSRRDFSYSELFVCKRRFQTRRRNFPPTFYPSRLS